MRPSPRSYEENTSTICLEQHRPAVGTPVRGRSLSDTGCMLLLASNPVCTHPDQPYSPEDFMPDREFDREPFAALGSVPRRHCGTLLQWRRSRTSWEQTVLIRLTDRELHG
ncbi:hypothetical protein GCM10028833_31400 [Glycomyces tarimensis]